MKNLLFIFSTIILMTTWSCSSTTTTNTTGPVLKMKVDGVDWTSESATGIFVAGSAAGNPDGITVNGSRVQDKFQLVLYKSAIGNYSILAGSSADLNTANLILNTSGVNKSYTVTALSTNKNARLNINWIRRGISYKTYEGVEIDFSGVLYHTSGDSVVISNGTLRY
ncbi:MAG: hypothetical protein IPK03_02970 [Bacteroidetes bacterium]|nr:hypothetical protein [Bacteroidota bacterium]